MEEKKRFKTYKIIMLIVLVAFITFIITSIGMYQYFTKNNFGNKLVVSSSNNGEITSELSKYRSLIDKYFLGDIDENKLKEGAIKGYIEGLNDPYTEYISKEDMQDYMADATGNFVGIGIYMVKDTEANKIMVLSPIKGSPAEKAGILPGDLIVSVDGVQYTAEEMSVASNKIKGEEGTNVKIEILRGTETKSFELKRENIKVNPVEGKVLQNNIGYIEFSSFDEGTANEFKAKFEELSKQGIKSLIIDLRNNGGGIVDEALEIADYILAKDDVILYEVDKNNKEKIEKAKNDPIINMPIVVLTNENTASSSEILAGALKDHNKAKIVGKKTYGKGVIQQLLTLPDGSGLKITAEEYLSGKLSVLRNRNLANVFYRLRLVEIFGTGIIRIKQLYAESLRKPDFEVSENAIKIVLPIFETNVNLTKDEKVIYKFLSKTMLKPISEIAPYVPFGKSKTTQLLKTMGEKGVVAVEGKGRGTKYIIK
jgi:carboxyl-terminal processing protease